MERFEPGGYWDKMSKKKEPIKETEPFKESLQSKLDRYKNDLKTVEQLSLNSVETSKALDKAIDRLSESLLDLYKANEEEKK